ncbi:MAG: hypothetical protein WAU01_11150 [Saprospiraceae bacterium]
MLHRNLYLFFIFCSATLIAQDQTKTLSEYYPFKNEIGINFTNVLGNVLSLNPNNANSPYGLTYRRHLGKFSLRTAINVEYSQKRESDFIDNTFIDRNLLLTQVDFRVGLEKHLLLSKHFLFSYGIDLLGTLGKEKSDITNFKDTTFTSFTSNSQTYGGGLGPVLRLEYKISDRIFISTESTLYGFYSRTTENIVLNSISSDEPTKSNASFELILPQSLFFNISF